MPFVSLRKAHEKLYRCFSSFSKFNKVFREQAMQDSQLNFDFKEILKWSSFEL